MKKVWFWFDKHNFGLEIYKIKYHTHCYIISTSILFAEFRKRIIIIQKFKKSNITDAQTNFKNNDMNEHIAIIIYRK